jgi:hypothetical protein
MAKKVKSRDPLKKPVGAKRSSRKRKSVKKVSKKSAKKQTRRAAAKRAKKPAKARRRRALKVGKQAVKIPPKGLGPGSAPTILLLKEGGRVEPVWIRYAQKAAAKPSKRPGVPTNIRVGNLVGWKTDGGKDRIGVVREFLSDSAVVGMGGKTELIRIARLTKISERVKGI